MSEGPTTEDLVRERTTPVPLTESEPFRDDAERDTPPRVGADRAVRPEQPSDKSPDAPPRPIRRAPLEKRLGDFFGHMKTTKEGVPYCTGAAGIFYVFDPFDGQVIALNSEAMAAAWANLARQNERVNRFLERLLSGGAWGEAIGATLPVVLIIASHHGLIPANILGLAGGAPPAPEEGTSEQPVAPESGGPDRGAAGPVDEVSPRVPPGL